MEKTLLKVTIDENDMINTEIPDRELAVRAITDVIWESVSTGDTKGLDTLFAITVHVLAHDTTGTLEEDYLNNLKETAPKYRKAFKELLENITKNENMS